MTGKRKHRELSEKQFHQMLSVGAWHSDPVFAKMLKLKAAYFGPDDQLLMVGMTTAQKFAVWINWATAYRETQEKLPRGGPYKVFAYYKIQTKSFLHSLGPHATTTVIENQKANLIPSEYPAEEGGAEFTHAVVKVGSKLIELRPSLHWEIESKQGTVVSVALRSDSKTLLLDAKIYDAFSEHGQFSDLEKYGVDFYAKMYAKSIDYEPSK